MLNRNSKALDKKIQFKLTKLERSNKLLKLPLDIHKNCKLQETE